MDGNARRCRVWLRAHQSLQPIGDHCDGRQPRRWGRRTDDADPSPTDRRPLCRFRARRRPVLLSRCRWNARIVERNVVTIRESCCYRPKPPRARMGIKSHIAAPMRTEKGYFSLIDAHQLYSQRPQHRSHKAVATTHQRVPSVFILLQAEGGIENSRTKLPLLAASAMGMFTAVDQKLSCRRHWCNAETNDLCSCFVLAASDNISCGTRENGSGRTTGGRFASVQDHAMIPTSTASSYSHDSYFSGLFII